MLEDIEKSPKIQYQIDMNLPVQNIYDTIQIYTAEQILNGMVLNVPPSLLKVKTYREAIQGNLFNH